MALNLRAFGVTPEEEEKKPQAKTSGLNLSAFGINQEEPTAPPVTPQNKPQQQLPPITPPTMPQVQLPQMPQQGTDMIEEWKNRITNVVRDTVSRFTPQDIVSAGDPVNAVKAALKPDEEKKITNFAVNLAKTIFNGQKREHKNAPRGSELVKEYTQGQIVEPFKQGVAEMNKPAVENKVIGGLQAFGAALSATPPGIAYNTIVGISAGTVRAARDGKESDPEIRKAITTPTSIATDVFGIQDPSVAFVVDIAVSRSPKSVIKDPTGLKSIEKVIKGGKTMASNFRMTKNVASDLDEAALDTAHNMITNPEKYLTETKISPNIKTEALQAIRDDAVITLYKLAQHYLPDAEMKKFGLDNRYIPNDKIIDYDVDWKKLAETLGDLNIKNKLANVSDEPKFDIPNMLGFAGKNQAKAAQAGLYDTAYHGSQVKQFEGSPKASMGKMGNAFYLSTDKNKAQSFGRDKIISDDIINAKGETVKRTLREANGYPDSTVHEFSTKGLNIKTVADDNEFFRILGKYEPEEADKVFRLMGYDGVFNKSTGTYAIYKPEKLQPHVAQPSIADKPLGLGNVDKKTLSKGNADSVKGVARMTAAKKKADLEVKGTEELQQRQAYAAIATEERAKYSAAQIKDINRLRASARSKAAREGDVETLRKQQPELTNRVIEFVKEVEKKDLSDEEALSIGLSLPTKADTIVKTPIELVQARGLTKDVKAFMQGVREGKRYSKEEIKKFQGDLINLMKELPISERGKLTFITGVKNANTATKVSREAAKIDAALTKFEEARKLSADLGRKRSNIAFLQKIGEFDSVVIRDVKKTLNIQKTLKEMTDDELNKVARELQSRLKFKEDKGFKIKGFASDEPVKLNESMYKANRDKLAENDSRIKKIGDAFKNAFTSPKDTLDNIFGTVSTRLKNIDPSLKRAMRDFEYKTAKAKQADRGAVEPFIKAIKSKKMNADDYADLDLALKNGDAVKIQSIMTKYGLEDDYARVHETLDNLYKRASDVGYDIGYQQNYFPRMIKDPEGFLEYLQKGDDWSIIDEAIKKKEIELGRYLTVEEKANLVNTLVRGYSSGQITLSETGAMKARSVEIVDPQLNEFYRDSVDSLLRYVDNTNDAIEARRFFGKGKATDQFANIDDSIGKYILDLVVAGKVKPSQEKQLRDILAARFNPVGTSGAINAYKNLAYIDTMGSVTSAVTQIGDLALALYKGGPIETTKALARAVLGKSKITRKDIGIEQIAEEFEDTSKSAKAVGKVFSAIGLRKMDTLGKETVINATIGNFRKQAKNPDAVFMRKLEAIFGDDDIAITTVLEDLKAGRITEDIKLMAFNELLDVQPVALSEMPVQYLKGGNGRIFYMLKTYTVKLFDVYRNEIWHEMVRDPKRGIRNLVYLTGSLVIANATADEIKDTILGRETSLEDRTVDNIMKLAGFSKFTIYKAREEGIGSATAKTILPPFKLIDSAYKDIAQQREVDKLESVNSIPVAGKLYYWWFGKGAQKKEDAKVTTEKKTTTPLKDRYLKKKGKEKKKSLRDRYLKAKD